MSGTSRQILLRWTNWGPSDGWACNAYCRK